MTFEIAIIGSGIACSMTLCELAERLEASPTFQRDIRVIVVEREGQLWNGVPYGRRSLVGALAFQKLQDFLEEPERTRYIDWLVANQPAWVEFLREKGGLGAAQWIAENQTKLDQGRWNELYLPRFLFGWYMSESVERACSRLKQKRVFVSALQGEAIAVEPDGSGCYRVTVETGEEATAVLSAARIVLAVGSPPQKALRNEVILKQRHYTHIEDLYVAAEHVNLELIPQVLNALPDKTMANILVVGSNASALEILYLIRHRPDIRNLVNSIVVLSHSGKLPCRISEQPVSFEFPAIEALFDPIKPFSADDLFAAISSDIGKAESLGLNIADLRDAVSALVNRSILAMNRTEQQRFACNHGFQFSRLMRRAGPDTRNATDHLVHAGLVTMVKGRFKRLEPCATSPGLVSAVYQDGAGGIEAIYPVPFCLTINCGGFEDLTNCSSRLLNNLVKNETCRVNTTHRGFLVNERLEAAPEFYVIGPLVAGNFNERIAYWHVELAGRIAGLAKILAQTLTESLYSKEAVLESSDPFFCSTVAFSL